MFEPLREINEALFEFQKDFCNYPNAIAVNRFTYYALLAEAKIKFQLQGRKDKVGSITTVFGLSIFVAPDLQEHFRFLYHPKNFETKVAE